MTKLSDHPDIIYKFRDWKNKFHRLIITRREIYFPSPKEFNDPYDCRIPESFYLLDTDEKIDKYFREFAIRNFDKLRSLGYDINKYIIHAKEDFKYCKKAYQEELNQKYLHEGDLYFGILSTSKIWNNIQMWAHYSAKHTGFCVGFDREILYENLPECNAASVHYTKKFPLREFSDILQEYKSLKTTASLSRYLYYARIVGQRKNSL